KRIKMEAAHGAVKIPRRTIELLSFPLIHVGPDDVAVGALKSGVDVEQGLHVVVARGQLADRLQGIAQRQRVHGCGLARLQRLHITAQELGPRSPRSGLQPQLRIFDLADDDEYSSRHLLLVPGRQRDHEASIGGAGLKSKEAKKDNVEQGTIPALGKGHDGGLRATRGAYWRSP